MLGARLEVETSKKCTQLGREAPFSSQNVQNAPFFFTTFGGWDVEKMTAIVARSTFWSHKKCKHLGVDVVLRGTHKGCCTLSKLRKRCRLPRQFQLQPLKSTPLHSNYNCVQLQPNYSTLHYAISITARSTTTTSPTTTTTSAHCSTLHWLHYTALSSTPLHFATLQVAALQTTTVTTTTTTLL